MITLLKSGYWRIMYLFYKDKTLKLHLREIARQTKLHEPSATRFLNALEKEDILAAQKEGNLKQYSIRKSKNTYLVFEMFDLERLENLPKIREQAIKTFLDKLTYKPVFAILFGSSAKGTHKEDSDIDILMIANRKIQTTEAEKEVYALTSIKVTPFQMNYKDFLIELKMKEDKVVQSAIASGYPLINHIQYYEVLMSERV